MVVGRRALLWSLALGAACLVVPPARAEDYPNRPIRMILPFSAGGGVDVLARLAAQHLSEKLGQSVVIENRVGGGGAVGASAVARAAPDGYTLLFHTTSSAVVFALMRKNLPYDPIKAFEPVTLVSRFPLAVFSNPDLPAKTMPDFVRLLKDNPGKYSYGSSGYGSITHLGAELFKFLANVDIAHIPYAGNAPALIDLLAGRIAMIIDGVPPQVENVKAGKVRALAVTTAERSDKFPDVPTMIESGFPGYELSFWTAIYAPAGTPKPIVDKLASAMAAAMKDRDLIERMQQLGYTGVGSTPEELNRYWHSQLERYGEIMRKAGIAPISE
jgi:tripartite-type tricarboxylate transporter receptor subunit TctC